MSTRARPARMRACALAVVLAVLGLLAGCVAEPGVLDPEPTTATTATPGASWPPAPEPTSPQPSATSAAPGDDPLRTSALYRIHPAADACALPVQRPRPPLPDPNLGPYVRELVECLTTIYTGPLAAVGIGLTKPKVSVYRGTVETPCGKLTQHSAPAFYCAESTTIYWPITGDEHGDAFTYARLGYVGLAAHEFGHHLQAATGILGAYAQERAGTPAKRRLELTRRLELQAQCFEGVTLAAQQDALRLTGQDRYELRLWREATGDEDPPDDRIADHGTSAAQLRWLLRGLDSADLGRCNTWTVTSGAVH